MTDEEGGGGGGGTHVQPHASLGRGRPGHSYTACARWRLGMAGARYTLGALTDDTECGGVWVGVVLAGAGGVFCYRVYKNDCISMQICIAYLSLKKRSDTSYQ